jgi:dUTP pyrophosphatase
MSESKYTIQLQPLFSDSINSYQSVINKGNTKKDSGFDLFVPKTEIIQPGEIKLINMGVKCAITKKQWDTQYQRWKLNIPCPYYLYARSSVSKRGIILANSVGIIDSGYRGPLMAAFYNTKNQPVTIPAGDRIVQICLPELSYDFQVNLVDSLDNTERGEGGLGSTGQ